MPILGWILSGTLAAIAGLAAFADTTLSVAPDGNDSWNGTQAARKADAAASDPDGPLASLARARDVARELRKAGKLSGPLRIQLRGGAYYVSEPIVFEPEDSGTVDAPVYVEAYPGETPVIHGGRRLRDWKQEGAKWVAAIPELKDTATPPSAFWVNGQRRVSARTPNARNPVGDFPEKDESFYAAPVLEKDAAGKETKSASRFSYRPEELQAWEGLSDAVVVVFHSWETSLLRVKTLDAANHVVEFTHAAPWNFGYWTDQQRYYVENLMEGLDQPGEWCFERKSGTLHYLPMPGEDPTTAEAVIPTARQLLLLKGDAASGKLVDYLHFTGLRFHYSDYPIGPEGHCDGQAAASVSAAVEATGARHCVFERCEVAHTGGYGVWFHSGSQDNQLQHSEVHDLGAGAVRIGEGGSPATDNEAVLRNAIDNCYLHDGGRIFRGAVGVWIGRSSYNTLSHNEICDFRYTGISVGWSWGYDASSANHNVIEGNHVHDIGLGQLNDMGGIYTLGVSPGTVIRGNIFHDVLAHKDSYGGWGIYFDEGSTGVLAESNLVYNTLTGSFHQHYGEDNAVVNNILAYSHRDQIIRSREEDHLSFRFERNIVYFNNDGLLGSHWNNQQYRLDNNCYWTTSGEPLYFAGRTLEEWRATGQDQHSIIADPLFVSAESADFALKPGSPALAVGFVPFDTSRVGLYGDPEWVARPKQVVRPVFAPPMPPPPPNPIRVSEGFEAYADGASIKGPQISEEPPGTIRVSASTAATGSRSLKFADAAGLKHRYDPHLFYTPRIMKGLVVGRFAVRPESGAEFYHEWREQHAGSYSVGPSLRIDGTGQFFANGQALGKVEIGEWTKLEIRYVLRQQGQPQYSVKVEAQNRSICEYSIKCDDRPLRRLDWWGFVSNADGPATFYIDDLDLRTE